MLDVSGHSDPRMHALFVDGVPRTWERGICERSDRNGDELWGASERVKDRGATRGAKVEMELTPGVADAYVFATVP